MGLFAKGRDPLIPADELSDRATPGGPRGAPIADTRARPRRPRRTRDRRGSPRASAADDRAAGARGRSPRVDAAVDLAGAAWDSLDPPGWTAACAGDAAGTGAASV